MDHSVIINSIKNDIKSQFDNDSSGHDWFHIERVWKVAKQIAEQESKVNVFITELGALLHDIADHKFVKNYEEESIKRTTEILSKYPAIKKSDIDVSSTAGQEL